nr:HPr family phosphocarrier protein [uncultured Caproiciproducens sp.]
MSSFVYLVQEPMGLHARPVGMLVKQLKNYACDIQVICGKRQADAKRLFAVMGMAVKCGETVTVVFTGEDEQEAYKETKIFFEKNF